MKKMFFLFNVCVCVYSTKKMYERECVKSSDVEKTSITRSSLRRFSHDNRSSPAISHN